MRVTPPVGSNASHALSYAVPWPKDEVSRQRFQEGVTGILPSEIYSKAFARWKRLQEERGALLIEATLGGALAVGLGSSSPLEVGLTLHKTYGVPLIPGTAIKGTCLRAIATLPESQQNIAKKLFGSQAEAGYARFYDAWILAASTPLQVDVIAVHHPSYYQLKDSWPTDFDDPVPVSFLSVPAGAKFLFAIEIPGASGEWRVFAEHMLHHALTEIGIGSKTQAGYGWFEPWLAPPSIVWENAEIQRRNEPGGRWVVRVRFGEKRATISQNMWQALPRPVPNLNQNNLRANVTVEQDGDEYRVVGVTFP